MGVVRGRRRPLDARLAGAALLLAVMLTGCTDGQEVVEAPAPTVVEVSETPTVQPSVSATPSATVSTEAGLGDEELLALMPPLAARDDLAGAVYTAEFFLEQYAPMFHTGDTSVWEALSLDRCGYCSRHLENAIQVREQGWTAEGGEIRPGYLVTEAYLADEDHEASVLVHALLEESRLFDADGAQASVAASSTAEFYFLMVFEGQVWRVDGVHVVDSPQ